VFGPGGDDVDEGRLAKGGPESHLHRAGLRQTPLRGPHAGADMHINHLYGVINRSGVTYLHTLFRGLQKRLNPPLRADLHASFERRANVCGFFGRRGGGVVATVQINKRCLGAK